MLLTSWSGPAFVYGSVTWPTFVLWSQVAQWCLLTRDNACWIIQMGVGFKVICRLLGKRMASKYSNK